MKKILLYKNLTSFSSNLAHLYEHLIVNCMNNNFGVIANYGFTTGEFVFLEITANENFDLRFLKISSDFSQKSLRIAINQMELEDWGEFKIINEEKLFQDLRLADEIAWENFSSAKMTKVRRNFFLRKDKNLKFIDQDDLFRDVKFSIITRELSEKELLATLLFWDFISGIFRKNIIDICYFRNRNVRVFRKKYLEFSALVSVRKSEQNLISPRIAEILENMKNGEKFYGEFSEFAKNYHQIEDIDLLNFNLFFENDLNCFMGAREIVNFAVDYLDLMNIFDEKTVKIMQK